ncbi:MAG: type II toxin-antitoxin system RelE/ParE family toxin [Chitinophagales bacterium]|nr:type II toxin-antitoxin system RelE/ParE family toxin [Chitinophagales bacterium]
MAFEIIWTTIAIEDFRAVVVYLEEQWSAKTAQDFVDNLWGKIEILSMHPYLGKQSESDETVRRLLITKHNTLYYTLLEDTIIVLEIFDNRQNPDTLAY